MSQFITIKKALEKIGSDSISELKHKIQKGVFTLVFPYEGNVCSNEMIESLHNAENDDPNPMIGFMNGDISFFPEDRGKGHFCFYCSGWFECEDLNILTEGQSYQLTANVIEVCNSNAPLKKGDKVIFTDEITAPDDEYGWFPSYEKAQDFRLTIHKGELLCSVNQIQTDSLKNKGAIDCNTKKNEYKEGQGDSLLILGAVMSTIKSVAKPNYTDDKLIEAILENYKNIYGISESTLRKKFSESKRYLKQRFE